MEAKSVSDEPPGKSQRAVPKSGMNSVSPTNAALPITWTMQAGVWPGVCNSRIATFPPSTTSSWSCGVRSVADSPVTRVT